ncbi:hypothetical protein, variant 1 [Aphanomyces invadans]|uniref:oligopeptidase A n=1 Tax=Aphanomyces invadans TaxID=157072 RepID=A0A024TM52_9STRA|nr:hypothetical protein, variant 1 [Aphanomyces invadans]ETV95074.1 hypothetical protein, variant 1 [Aphanomyces invadans]|eukprot:XP_008876249.1 hypothetical protein, variant 1 [Aphanomyces invadans]
MVNPLTRCMEDYCLPPYATFHTDDIVPAVRTALAEYALDLNALEDDLMDAGESNLCWESVMDRLEIIDDPLRRISMFLEHLRSVVDSPDLRAADAEIQPEILAMNNRRDQSDVVFQAMQRLRSRADFNTAFTTEQQRILTRKVLHATLNGAALGPCVKERFNEISVRLETLKMKFSENLMDAMNAFSRIVHDKHELQGLSDATLAHLAQNAVADGHKEATAATGPWKLSLEYPVYMPVMKQCSHRHTREILFRAFVTTASTPPFDNSPVVQEMLELRQARAQLLGFQTYAELSLQDKMAPSVEVVEDMLNDLRDKCLPLSKAELDEVEAFANAHGHISRLEHWDTAYWSEALRKARFDVDDELINPYFPFPRVLEGVFQLASHLFGLHFEAADGQEEIWHPDVRFIQVRDMDEPDTPVVGHFYLDPYARPCQKNIGTWCDAIAYRSKVLRTDKAPVRLPVFCLALNQTPPVDSTTGLMSIDDVLSLVHMFGHGLRMLLTTADYSAASSMDAVEWDAIDIPSQFLSHFCDRRETIRMMSGHIETGAPLPDDLIDKVLEGRKFMGATSLLRQLHFGATDMAIHHRYDPQAMDTTIDDVQRRITQQFSVLPRFDHDKLLCSFRHIFAMPYAAGYYSYVPQCDPPFLFVVLIEDGSNGLQVHLV